jgi:hypothetical protein
MSQVGPPSNLGVRQMTARHSRQNREYAGYSAKDQAKSLRGGAEVARQAHNLEVGGSIPPPAIGGMKGER